MPLTAKRKTPYLVIAILIVACALFVEFRPPLYVQYLEAKTFDLRILLRGPRRPADEIAIIAIDDQSLDQYHANIWPRNLTAELIRRASSAGAKVIGVDYIYSLPETSQGFTAIHDIREAYAKIPAANAVFRDYLLQQELHHDVDRALAAAIASAGNVVLAFAPRLETTPEQEVPPEFLPNYALMLVKKSTVYTPIAAASALTPIAELVSPAASIGHVYTQYDRDGAIRWEPLYVDLVGRHYPSFGLEAARLYLGLEPSDVKVHLGNTIQFANQPTIPTDAAGRVLLNYLGKTGTFPTYSAASVLAGKIPASAFQGKIVLIGATALGAGDIHVTPFAELPGVEKQATVIENILHNNFFYREEFTLLLDVVIILAFASAIALTIAQRGAIGGGLTFLALLAVYLTASAFAFSRLNIWMNLVVPVLSLVMLYLSTTAYRFLAEERSARRIKAIFSQYTTERVVNELIAHPGMAKLGGERKEMTVLFSDVRGFTTFSEHHEPEEVVAMLNEFLAAMTDVILHWDGTVDKFVGDEIMAFWGAPMVQENHAELAVRCALNMMERLHELQEKWRSAGKEVLDIGIGLNSGPMVVGNIGSESKKMDYTVIGDSVNLGARVESLTRQYQAHILITESTRELIAHLLPIEDGKTPGNGLGHVRLEKLGEATVKGKSIPVAIYNLYNLDT